MKHLRVSLILIALLLGVSGAAVFTADAGAPVGRGASTQRSYLPWVPYSSAPTPTSTPDPSGWITVVEEGFEAPPGSLWRFRDDSGTSFGAYHWGRRACLAYTGGYSAWASGGGADGELLPCGSTLPANIATTMIYGPFSLADATAATLRFRLRFDKMASGEDFCWLATDGAIAAGPCLTTQPATWSAFVLDLGDLDPGVPGVSVLGQPEVRVAFRFTSDASGHASGGPFIDDVVIRKCTGAACLPISATGPAPGEAQPQTAQIPSAR